MIRNFAFLSIIKRQNYTLFNNNNFCLNVNKQLQEKIFDMAKVANKYNIPSNLNYGLGIKKRYD